MIVRTGIQRFEVMKKRTREKKRMRRGWKAVISGLWRVVLIGSRQVKMSESLRCRCSRYSIQVFRLSFSLHLCILSLLALSMMIRHPSSRAPAATAAEEAAVPLRTGTTMLLRSSSRERRPTATPQNRSAHRRCDGYTYLVSSSSLLFLRLRHHLLRLLLLVLPYAIPASLSVPALSLTSSRNPLPDTYAALYGYISHSSNQPSHANYRNTLGFTCQQNNTSINRSKNFIYLFSNRSFIFALSKLWITVPCHLDELKKIFFITFYLYLFFCQKLHYFL